jgi:hypothetical protein
MGDGKHAGELCPMMPWRSLGRLVVLLAATGALSACNTPTGIAPSLRGTYWDHALVTNPNGGGPQVVIWGPPDPSFPDN